MTSSATLTNIIALRTGSRLLRLMLLAAIAAGPTAVAHARSYELLYTHRIGSDESSRNVTFLGRGVLMLAEAGPYESREVRVFSAQTGRALHTLPCPAIDPTRDDLSYDCPTSVVATGRFFVLQADQVIRVFARSGALLSDVVPPPDLPREPHPFDGRFAIRGRRIAQGGPAFDGRRRVPGFTVYLYDAPTGALLDQHRIDLSEDYFVSAVVFAGRALVVRLRPPWRDPRPDILVAIDPRTGARLWTREAVSAAGRHFWPGLIGLGSDVMAGDVRLSARTGEVKVTYPHGKGDWYGEVAASGRLVAIAADGVQVFSAGGTFLHRVLPPPTRCDDAFAETIGLAAGRLLVTTDSYCGRGYAYVFGLRSAHDVS